MVGTIETNPMIPNSASFARNVQARRGQRARNVNFAARTMLLRHYAIFKASETSSSSLNTGKAEVTATFALVRTGGPVLTVITIVTSSHCRTGHCHTQFLAENRPDLLLQRRVGLAAVRPHGRAGALRAAR